MMKSKHSITARLGCRERAEKILPEVTEARALVQLREMKQAFARYIGKTYGHLAVDCATCQTPCCADAEFVNVNITRLEAVAMLRTLEASSNHGPEKVAEVLRRAAASAQEYGLTEEGDTFEKTYACPLFEPGKGCMVHWKAKPAPCIQHGCYERWQDLPETRSMRRVEHSVAKLNEQVYDEPVEYQTIPIWLLRVAKEPKEPIE